MKQEKTKQAGNEHWDFVEELSVCRDSGPEVSALLGKVRTNSFGYSVSRVVEETDGA
jgi:hypothetical protein